MDLKLNPALGIVLLALNFLFQGAVQGLELESSALKTKLPVPEPTQERESQTTTNSPSEFELFETDNQLEILRSQKAGVRAVREWSWNHHRAFESLDSAYALKRDELERGLKKKTERSLSELKDPTHLFR